MELRTTLNMTCSALMMRVTIIDCLDWEISVELQVRSHINTTVLGIIGMITTLKLLIKQLSTFVYRFAVLAIFVIPQNLWHNC